MARVLNAEAVQKAFKSRRKEVLDEGRDIVEGGVKAGKKRKRDEVDSTRSMEGTKAELRIKPGESLAHFRRCVSTRWFSLESMKLDADWII